MKNFIALALLFALGALALIALSAAAQANLAPVEPQQTAVPAHDLAIATGAAGATLEQDYFRAPSLNFAAGRIFPCRLQLRIFDKTHLAQSCN
jgi:hypothetical protein